MNSVEEIMRMLVPVEEPVYCSYCETEIVEGPNGNWTEKIYNKETDHIFCDKCANLLEGMWD